MFTNALLHEWCGLPVHGAEDLDLSLEGRGFFAAEKVVISVFARRQVASSKHPLNRSKGLSRFGFPSYLETESAVSGEEEGVVRVFLMVRRREIPAQVLT